MPKLLFVTFDEKPTGGFFAFMARCGVLKSRVGYSLLKIFYKRLLYGGVRSIDPVSGTEIFLLGLPIPLSYLRFFNPICLERGILDICRENKCTGYFVPMEAKEEGRFGTSTDTRVIRHLAFRSLLLPLLEKIYAGSAVSLDNIDIVFVHGGENVLLQALIRQIEPRVRFVRVAAKDAKSVEAQLAGICEESGITVQVGSDYRRALRGADLVIITGHASDLRGCRAGSNTVVVDYSDGGLPGLQGGFQYIKGVVYAFPQGLYSRLGEDVAGSYGKAELTDILLMLKTGLIYERQFSDAAMEKISEVFKVERCRITGFVGRRGTVMPGVRG